MTSNAATIADSGGGVSSWAGPIVLTGTNTVDATGGNLTLSGIISGAGAITKIGVNNLILTGVNTYTGDTRIVAGILQLDAAVGTAASGLAGSTLDMNTADAGTLNFGASALTTITSATVWRPKGLARNFS